MGSGHARNQPCWCGSGKKGKHCHNSEKPRSTTLIYDFGEPVAPDSIEINRETSEVRFWRDGQVLRPRSAKLEQSYDRPKGPKVLNRLFFEPDDRISFSLPSALWRFDRLYAVDTNTKDSAFGTVAVGAILCGVVKPISATVSMATFQLAAAFELRGPKLSPERVVWRALIDRIQRATDFDSKWRVGVIVDSELHVLMQLNAGTEPLADDFRIPPNFEFLYASADVQGASVINQALAKCDWISGVLLNNIISGAYGEEGLVGARPEAAARFRFWVRTREPDRLQLQVQDPRVKHDSLFRLHRETS